MDPRSQLTCGETYIKPGEIQTHEQVSYLASYFPIRQKNYKYEIPRSSHVCLCMYMVELQEAEKSICAIIDTKYVPSAPWTDYPIFLTRHGLT